MRENCTSGATREGITGLTVRPLYSTVSIRILQTKFQVSEATGRAGTPRLVHQTQSLSPGRKEVLQERPGLPGRYPFHDLDGVIEKSRLQNFQPGDDSTPFFIGRAKNKS